MKKITLIALLAAFTSINTFAQDTPATPTTPAPQESPALRMGLSVSPMFSWFAMDVDDSYVKTDGSRFNIQYGLHIDKRLGGNPNYFLSTGIFVMNTGGTLRYKLPEQEVDGELVSPTRISDLRFNYINIPATIMLRTNDIGYSTYFARVGIDNGFNIAASQDYLDVDTDEEFEKEDAEDLIALYRAALHIELGMEYNFSGNSRLMVSAEWNNGLNNIFSDDFNVVALDGSSPTETKRVKARSHAIMLRVGVYF